MLGLGWGVQGVAQEKEQLHKEEQVIYPLPPHEQVICPCLPLHPTPCALHQTHYTQSRTSTSIGDWALPTAHWSLASAAARPASPGAASSSSSSS